MNRGLIVGTARRSRRRLLRETALQAAGVLVFAQPALAQLAPTARPTGGQVVAGQASIGQTAARTTVDQSSQRAAIDWRSFDVGAQHTVQFNQPNTAATTLNRVTGPDPSQIAGRIVANGNIIITNGAGIVFHDGAQVNANSLVASAPGITNQNFMAGRMVFDQAPKPGATVSNAGTITVKQAGLAALVAPRVANSGTINARLGHVVLAGAEAHTIDLYGDGLVSIDVTKSVSKVNGTTALVTNSGTIVADGGTVQLTARAADGIVQNLVDAGGTIRANTVAGRPGQILVDGVGGSVRIAGQLTADGGPGQPGGTVAVTATNRVTAASGSRISANGENGGTVALGTTAARARAGRAAALGNGKSPGTPANTAREVLVEDGARVTADGTGRGSGGTVAVLSKQTTQIDGQLSARGGPTAGDGGVVEASSDNVLLLNSVPDARAPAGHGGTIFLDPYDLVVGTGTPQATLNNNNGGTASTANDGATSGTSYITPNQLQQAADNGAVQINLSATHDLTVREAVSLTSGINTGESPSGGASLSLHADHDLTIRANITIGDQGSGRTLQLDAGHNIFIGQDPTTGTLYPVTLTADGNITATSIGALSGGSAQSITIGNGSALRSASALDLQATNRIDIGTGVALASGNQGTFVENDAAYVGIRLLAGTDITIGANSTLTANPTANNASQGYVEISAGNAIGVGANARIDAGGSSNLLLSANSATASQFNANAPQPTNAGSLLVGTGAFVGNADSVQVAFGCGACSAAATTTLSAGSTIQSTPNGTINIYSGDGTITLAGNISTQPTNTASFDSIYISTGGAVVQTGGSIATTDLTGTAASFALTSAGNQITGIATGYGESLQSTGNTAVTTGASALTVGGRTSSIGGGSSVGGGASTGGGIQVGSGATISLSADQLTIGPGVQFTPQSEGSINATLYAPNGTVTIAPLTAGRGVELASNGKSGGVLSVSTAELGFVDTNEFVLGSTAAGNLVVGTGGTTATVNLPQLDLVSGGTITQRTPLSVSTLAAYSNSVTLTQSANNIGGLVGGASTNGFTLVDGEILAVSGTVTDSSFVSLTGNGLGTRATITAPSVSLVSNGSSINGGGIVTINGGQINASTRLTLTAARDIEQSDGILNTALLTGSAGGEAQLAITANAIASVGNFSSNNGLRLANGRSLTVTGPFSDNTSMDLNIAGGLTLAGTVTTPTLSLRTTGDITQTGGAITTTDLTGNGANVSLLSNGNAVSQLDDFTATGNFSLANASALTVYGAVSVGGGATLSLAADNITFGAGGQLTAPNGIVALAPLTSGRAFTLTSGAINTNAITAATLRVGSQTTGNVSISGAFALTNIGTLDLQSGAAILEGTGDRLQVARVTGTANSASLAGNNAIGTLGSFATQTGFFLNDNAALTVAGPVTDPAAIAITATGLTTTGTIQAPQVTLASRAVSGGGGLSQTGGQIAAATKLTLTADGSVNQSGGAISTAQLTGSSGGSTSITGGSNAIGTIGAYSSRGGFQLRDAQGLTVAGPLSDTALVNLGVTGGLTLTGTLNAPTVSLGATGAISQSTGAIVATTLTGTAGSAALLSGGNTVANLGQFTTAGAFSLADGSALNVAGAVSVGSGQTLSLASDSIGIGSGGSLSAPGGTVALAPLSVGQPFTLTSNTPTSAITANTLRIGSGTTGNVSVSGAFALTNVGTLDLESGAAILEGTGDQLQVARLIGSAASASLLGTNNQIATLGGFTTRTGFTLVDNQALAIVGPVTDNQSISITATPSLTASGNVTAPNVTLVARPASIGGGGTFTQTAGTISASTQLSLTAANAVTQTAGTDGVARGGLVAASLTGSAGGPVSLQSGNNQIGQLGDFSSNRGFSLADAISLTVAGTVTDNTSIGLAVAAPSLAITGSLAAPAVRLGTTGSLTEPGGTITATTLTGSANDAALTSATNQVANLGQFTTAAGFALADAQPLNVSGTVSVGGGQTLSLASNTISLAATSQLLAPGGVVAVAPLTAGQPLSLGSFVPSGAIVADTLRVGSATTGDIGISGAFVLDAVRALDLRSAGQITEAAGASIQVASLTGQADVAQLAGANQIAALGPFAVTGTNLSTTQSALTLVDAAALAIAGPVTAGAGTVAITAASDLSVAAAVTANAGNVQLTAGRNLAVTTAGSVAAANGTADLEAAYGNTAGALSIGGSVRAAGITAGAGTGGITLAADLTAPGLVLLQGAGNADPALVDQARGAIVQTGGTVTAGSLTARGTAVTLGGANQIGALAGTNLATAADFVLADAIALNVAGPVTAANALRLTADGDLSLAANLTAPTLTLAALGNVGQPDGTLSANTLAVTANAAALGRANAVGTLDGFSVGNALALTTSGALAVGSGTAGALTLETAGPLSFAGQVTVPGALLVNAAGSVLQTGGSLSAGSLAGTAVGQARFGTAGTASVAVLGPYTVTASAGRTTADVVAAGGTPTANAPATSTLLLADAVPLTVTGPLSAGTITLSAPTTLTVQGGRITADNASLSAARIVQTGTTTLSTLSGTTGAITLALPTTGGTVSLNDLAASGSVVNLGLAGGTASGVLTAAGLQVNGSGGGASLAGTVAGVGGPRAAANSSISPAIDSAYQINGCTIGLATCGATVNPGNAVPNPGIDTPNPGIAANNPEPIFTPGEPFVPAAFPLVLLDAGVPLLTPKSFLETTLGNILKPDLFIADLIAVGIVRSPTDPELLLPNISDRDY